MGRIDAIADGGCITLWLDNSKRKNAIDDEMLFQLLDLLSDAGQDSRCRLVAFRGVGGSFCAGRDVSGLGKEQQRDPLQTLSDLLGAIRSFPKPTLAVVEGPAVGLGMAIVCACDLVIADETAKFGVPEAKLGLTPSLTAVSAIRTLPRKIALDLMFAGRFLNAEEAVRYGLANQAVTSAGLEAARIKAIENIRAMSPNALKRAKRLLLASETLDVDAAMQAAVDVARQSLTDPDSREGLYAFRKKQKPSWATDL
jgi:methylglutaconyl-CoA hydratase